MAVCIRGWVSWFWYLWGFWIQSLAPCGEVGASLAFYLTESTLSSICIVAVAMTIVVTTSQLGGTPWRAEASHIFIQNLKLGIWHQAVDRLSLLWGCSSWVTDVIFFCLPCMSVSLSLLKDVSPTELRPTLMDSFHHSVFLNKHL